ncbi:unnamed protein product, partial [Cladocopium goreaui]
MHTYIRASARFYIHTLIQATAAVEVAPADPSSAAGFDGPCTSSATGAVSIQEPPQAEGIHQIGDRFEVVVDSTVGKITQTFDTRKKAESWYAAALDLKAKNSLGPLLKGFQAAVESNSKHLEACESVKGNHVMEALFKSAQKHIGEFDTGDVWVLGMAAVDVSESKISVDQPDASLLDWLGQFSLAGKLSEQFAVLIGNIAPVTADRSMRFFQIDAATNQDRVSDKKRFGLVQTMKSGLSFWQCLLLMQQPEWQKVRRGPHGTPMVKNIEESELKAARDLQGHFLELLREFQSQVEDTDPEVQKLLRELGEDFKKGAGVEVYYLWIVAHVLQIQIRCSMRPNFAKALSARENQQVEVLEDAVYGPKGKPVLHVFYSPKFNHQAERFLHYDFVYPDAGGNLLLCQTTDVYHSKGHLALPDLCLRGSSCLVGAPHKPSAESVQEDRHLQR